MLQGVFELERVQVSEQETSGRQFEPEQPSSAGLQPPTQEKLRALKRCLLEHEQEESLQGFLSPKEIGRRANAEELRKMRNSLGGLEKGLRTRLEMMADIENQNALEKELKKVEALAKKAEASASLGEVG